MIWPILCDFAKMTLNKTINLTNQLTQQWCDNAHTFRIAAAKTQTKYENHRNLEEIPFDSQIHHAVQSSFVRSL
jgi:ABC-type uncharacterized transport system fused permease/ATPase subunit